MNNNKILFFFTADFPFGNQEAFLEREVDYLSKKFSKVVIISGATDLSYRRSTPKKVSVINVPYENNFTLTEIILSLFQFKFYYEIFLLVFIYHKLPIFGRIKTIFKSHVNSNILARLYSSEISKYKEFKKYLYSFWFNDSTISLGILKKKNKGFIAVTRAHRWDLYFEQSKYNYLPFRKQTSKYLDTIFSASQEGIDYCKKNWKISNNSKLKLSRLGVRSQNLIIKKSERKIIVSCSNLYSWKRVDKIIKSLSKVKTSDIEWYHFGDGPEYEKIINLANHQLKNNVVFKFLGRVENNSLLDWYKEKSPSLFINLSSSEGVPVSIMEAMSFGIPCIATNVGGCRELVTENSGFPVDVNLSNEKIARIIDDFLNLNLEKQEEKRKNAYNHIINKFNAEKNYALFCSNILAY
jgi:glycosyltransferase involved in cell wall biosynthesis